MFGFTGLPPYQHRSKRQSRKQAYGLVKQGFSTHSTINDMIHTNVTRTNENIAKAQRHSDAALAALNAGDVKKAEAHRRRVRSYERGNRRLVEHSKRTPGRYRSNKRTRDSMHAATRNHEKTRQIAAATDAMFGDAAIAKANVRRNRKDYRRYNTSRIRRPREHDATVGWGTGHNPISTWKVHESSPLPPASAPRRLAARPKGRRQAKGRHGKARTRRTSGKDGAYLRW